MSTDERPPLRVGGWVPPYRDTGAGSPPDALVLPPEPELPGAASGSGAGSRDGRRRVLVVAGAALAVLGVTSLAVYETTGPTSAGTPRFVSLPAVPTLPAFPVPTLSASASPAGHGIGGSAVASKLAHSASASPATPSSAAPPSSAAAPSKPSAASSRPPAATTKPAPPAPDRRGPFTVGAAVSLEPAGQGGYLLRHRDYRARVDRIGPRNPALDKADSRFLVRAGLADAGCVSLESANYPGSYLRHRDSQVWLDPRRGTSLFAADATFCVVERGDGTVLLRSHNYPDRYLQVRRSRVDLGGRGTAFAVRGAL